MPQARQLTAKTSSLNRNCKLESKPLKTGFLLT